MLSDRAGRLRRGLTWPRLPARILRSCADGRTDVIKSPFCEGSFVGAWSSVVPALAIGALLAGFRWSRRYWRRMANVVHRQLRCGIEFAGEVLPDRHAVTAELRMFAGMAYESPEHLGLTHLVVETIDKGTAKRDGRAFSDAFDAMGARHGAWAGREAIGFQAVCLPEFMDGVVDLLAEEIRTPTFPEEAVGVAIDLARQELTSLEDDPRELADKMIVRQSYGERMGRHPLGEPETLDRISRDTIVRQWSETFGAGRMQVAVAGRFDPERVIDRLESAFEGFGVPRVDGRECFPLDFQPVRTHRDKDLEQEHIGICFPGVPLDSPWYPTQRVLLAILSGGMSSRLFTELREKQALVYWVSAWTEYPRGSGMIHLGASTTPERCDKTYTTLLREIDRLSEDLEQGELQRATTGIIARTETRGDITKARCAELANDLFHHGRIIPMEQKMKDVAAVRLEDIREFLAGHPRDRLSVVTLGPRALAGE
jgi:predicted Zn-dependent peptidase